MASTIREQKAAAIAEITAKIKACNSFVVIDYKGITVEQDTALRSAFRKSGVEYKVLKNRLANIALKELGYTQFEKQLEGANAFAFYKGDEISTPAKIALAKSAEFKKLEAKCGMAEGTYIDANGVKQLATMPGKKGLIAQVLGLLMSPISGLARALSLIAEKKSA